jgi:hypothetical protein
MSSRMNRMNPWTVALLAFGIGIALQALVWLGGLTAETRLLQMGASGAVLSETGRAMLLDTLLIFAPGALLVGVGFRRRPQVLAWLGVAFIVFGEARTAAYTLL